MDQCSYLSKLEAFASNHGVSIDNARRMLFNACVSNLPEALRTDELLELILLRAEVMGINPISGELKATSYESDRVSLYLSTDGYLRIANAHPEFDGLEIQESDERVDTPIVVLGKKVACPTWVSVTIHRKDRKIPTVVKEYFDECYAAGIFDEAYGCLVDGPWQRSPKRQLVNRAVASAIRLAFGVVESTISVAVMRTKSESEEAHTKTLDKVEVPKLEAKPNPPQCTPPLETTQPTQALPKQDVERVPVESNLSEANDPMVVTEETVDALIAESNALTLESNFDVNVPVDKPHHSQEASKKEAKATSVSVVLDKIWELYGNGSMSLEEIRNWCNQKATQEKLPTETLSAILGKVAQKELAALNRK